MKAIAERAAKEHERAQREQISVEHPLQPDHTNVERFRYGWQRDVDDAPLEEDGA